jgi:hypothetical protein
MSTRVLGPKGSKRRKRFLLVPILLVACTALFLIGSAQAVHDLEFQLDGNALSTVCGTTPDGNCTTQVFDWGRPSGSSDANYLFNANRTVNTSVVNSANSTGFTAAAFQRDFGLKVSAADNCSLTSTDATKPFCTADTTTFATGSKDIQNISGGGADNSGNWQCNKDNNVNSKIDITNAYSASYTVSGGDRIMYFAMEKNKDNGNNNAGFWFLQGDANCVSTGSAVNFTGNHRNGDILVTSAFTSGGGVSSILVFRWAGGANGCIDSNPSAAPACDQQPIGSGGDCKTAPTTPPPAPVDTICGTTNSGPLPTNTNITVPWLTADATLGVGNTVVPPDFFEGAINISKAFREAPGGGSAPTCFNTFIADTRSSQSATATLFDFARGSLGQCQTSLTTSRGVSSPPVTGEVAPPADIGGGSVSSGTDTARLTVTGSTFSGTLTFYLCGPVSTDGCDRTKGVQVGSGQTVSANGAYVSGTATLTSAGRYCWTAHFEPDQASKDAGVSVGNDNGVNECFTVAKVTPSLTTCSGTFDASNVCTPSAAVAFGNAVSDRALLSGLAKEPGSGGPSTDYPTINPTTAGVYGGSIQFTLKGPASTGCGVTATGTGDNPQSVNVDTAVGNKVYGPVSFTPDAPGTYHWQATISNASSVNNILPVSDNANCDQSREDVVVQQISTEIATGPFTFPQDSATIRSSVTGDKLPAGGTVVFKLFGPTTGQTGLQNCQANGATGLVYGPETKTNVVPVGGAHEVTGINTNNTTFKIDSSKNGTYYWLVTYATGDTAHTSRQSACSESTAVTQTDDAGPGTLFTP